MTMILHPDAFLYEGWWIQLRNHTDARDTLGRNYCGKWSRNVIENFKGTLYEGRFSEYEDRQSLSLRVAGLQMHRWLETRENNRRFIADGTAGQIDLDYPYGFYGFLDESSSRLKAVYSNGQKVPLVKVNQKTSF